MKLENSFEVPAPPEVAWQLLMDVPRVVPCMPGAELTETVDEAHWKAKMQVKLGPISLTFDTDVSREEADEAARRTMLKARAREARGRGNAQATVTSSLSPAENGTRVDIVTDLSLSGQVAHSASPKEAQAAVARQSKPVAGLRLGLAAFARSLSRIFRRKERSGS